MHRIPIALTGMRLLRGLSTFARIPKAANPKQNPFRWTFRLVSTDQNKMKQARFDADSYFASSGPVMKIVEWLQANGVNEFTKKRSQPSCVMNTGISINLKGGYILSILTDPNVTYGQYAETGILKDGNLIVDKNLSPDGDCIMRHDSHEEVIEHIKKIIAVANAGELKNSRDHNW